MSNQLHQRNLSIWCKKHISKYLQSNESTESFMLKHFQRNNNNCMNITTFDQRRVVFVSLFSLCRTWKQCPSSVLYSALCILPLKRKWIYFPKKYQSEIESHKSTQVTVFSDCDAVETQEFISLLKWKDDQGLVIWTLDKYKYPKHHPSVNKLIDPFWYYLSDKLNTLYDPITRNKYNPIILDTKFWRNKQLWKGKYDVKLSSILRELYFCSLKYKSIQEIIFQSNPQSLVVIKSFTYNVFEEEKSNITLYNDIDDAKHDWVFTDCYDPYDI